MILENCIQAIYMYREVERNQWSTECALIIDRMKRDCFPMHTNHITHVHILDLHKDGHIRPHIDSIRVSNLTEDLWIVSGLIT